VFYEQDLVSPGAGCPAEQTPVPARSLAAEKFGNSLFANSIMLGALFRHLELIPEELSRAALEVVVPHARNKNAEALTFGWTGF
jgi:Pyruvate/2-oxoacid:ferredoxin oxidoreductase gamma subunit